jgi:Histidinol dehydrogenase
MKILDSKKKNFNSLLEQMLSYRKNKIKFDSRSVVKIVKDVKRNGDKALLKYEKKFTKNFTIISKSNEIKKQISTLDSNVKKSIDLAYNRIFKFHSKQKVKNIFFKDKLQNKLDYKYLPIESVGIYVPGGTASYPSTVLMNAIPAIIAGVKTIVMVSPRNNGKQNSGVLYAAKKCGIKKIYSIGGAQAISALAYGTKKVFKVNKIVGPGNLYVSAAKKKFLETPVLI